MSFECADSIERIQTLGSDSISSPNRTSAGRNLIEIMMVGRDHIEMAAGFSHPFAKVNTAFAPQQTLLSGMLYRIVIEAKGIDNRCVC